MTQAQAEEQSLEIDALQERCEDPRASLRTERSDAMNGAPGLTTRNKKLVASLLLVVRPGAPSSVLALVVRPGAPSSVLALVVRPGAPSSVLAPSSKARSP